MAGGSSNNAKPTKGTTEKKKRKRPSKKVPTTVVETSSNTFMNMVQKLTGSAEELNYHTGGGGGSSAAAPQSTSPSPYPSPYSSPSNHTSQHDQAGSEPHHGGSSYNQAQYLNSTNMDYDSGSSHNYSAYNPTPYSTGGSAYSHHNPGSQDHHHYLGSSYGYPGSNYSSDRHVGGGAARTNYDIGGSSTRVDCDEYRQAPDDDLYEGLYSPRSYYNSNKTTGDHQVDDQYDPASSRANYMEDDISPFSWRDPMNHNSTSDYWYHVDPMRAS